MSKKKSAYLVALKSDLTPRSAITKQHQAAVKLYEQFSMELQTLGEKRSEIVFHPLRETQLLPFCVLEAPRALKASIAALQCVKSMLLLKGTIHHIK